MEKALKFILWTVGIFVVLCLIGRIFLFETWTVPDDPWLSASVTPTLRAGDFVLVLTVGQAGYGDLVRCPDPEDEASYVVGRIYGTPSDVVEIKGRSIFINGKRNDTTEACTKGSFTLNHPDTGSQIEMHCARVELGGAWHFVGTGKEYQQSNDARHETGHDRVYLISDNRDLHFDSRDYGALPQESCKQRIFFRLWGNEGFSDSETRLSFIR